MADGRDIISVDGTIQRFKINYSKIKDMSINKHVTSPTFNWGGYTWAIRFFPLGCDGPKSVHSSLFLVRLHDHDHDRQNVKVTFTLGILAGDGTQGSMSLKKRFDFPFSDSLYQWGKFYFIKRADLEEHYVRNGIFVVFCTINMNDKVNDDGFEDICKLLESREMADVKFEVDGEVFYAHKAILGVRSPVFKAELFGYMSEARENCVKINDMNPIVFKALLHFVYTYSLPNEADTNLIQHLLVAADRYALKDLVTRCIARLIGDISLDTVLGFLTLAEQHNFVNLKKSCLVFATRQENFKKLALTKEYGQLTPDFPSLLTEFRQILCNSIDFYDIILKKRKHN